MKHRGELDSLGGVGVGGIGHMTRAYEVTRQLWVWAVTVRATQAERTLVITCCLLVNIDPGTAGDSARPV